MCFFSILRRHGEDDAIEFYLTLCFDVILEVLQFGDRRRLTKLERTGRRFHHLVEKCFRDVPFLRLNIGLEPGFVTTIFKINYKSILFSVMDWRRLLLVTEMKKFQLQI